MTGHDQVEVPELLVDLVAYFRQGPFFEHYELQCANHDQDGQSGGAEEKNRFAVQAHDV
jgi:hypothetical protein